MRFFRSAHVFQDRRVLLHLSEHVHAMLLERQSFINMITEVFDDRCSSYAMLINCERECRNDHSSMYPLPFGLGEIDRLFPLDGVGLDLIQCLLAY